MYRMSGLSWNGNPETSRWSPLLPMHIGARSDNYFFSFQGDYCLSKGGREKGSEIGRLPGKSGMLIGLLSIVHFQSQSKYKVKIPRTKVLHKWVTL